MQNNLYVDMLLFNNGYYGNLVDYCSIIVLFSGIAVIIVKNPIGSLIALIAVYGFISIYLMFAGLTFIAFSYIIVYIGAVSILFLFILMLINIRTSELQINNWNSIPLASSIVILLNTVLGGELPIVASYYNKAKDIFSSIWGNFSSWNNLPTTSLSTKVYNIMYTTSNTWDGNITETSHITSIGNILYTSYNMWLFITSIILLLAMVGAIIITIKQD